MTQPKPYSLPINIMFDGYDYDLPRIALNLNDPKEDDEDERYWPDIYPKSECGDY